MDVTKRQRMQAVAGVRNLWLAEEATRPRDQGYHEGFADGVKACMLLDLASETTPQSEKWLWARIKAIVDAVRPTVKRKYASRTQRQKR